MELGKTQAEVALTKHLAATLVKEEVLDPMSMIGWGHGAPPTPEMIAAIKADQALKQTALVAPTTPPPTGGQPAKTEGAPAPAAPGTATQSGQPAPPASPAPAAPAAKTDASSPDEAAKNVLSLFESLKDSSGKYMGKYDSLDEALKGAGHLANMAKTALRRAEEAEARLTAAPAPVVLTAPPAAVPAAVPAIQPFVPTSRPELLLAEARLAKVLAKVNEDGFDGSSAKEYAEATREVAEQTARAVAVEASERQDYARRVEDQKWNAVNAFMAEKYPESVHVNSDEFSLFVSLNPLLAEAMSALRAQGRETRAAELGYTEFAKARGSAPVAPGLSRADAERKEIELSAREQVRIEARDQALKDAGIVHGSAGGSSAVEAPGVTGASQDDINALAAAMRREGDAPGSPAATAWRRAVINLPPELFGGR